MILGWRKLLAWLLVCGFVMVASLGYRYEIPDNNADLIKWVTGFFFGSNAAVHGLKGFFSRKG